MNDESLIRHYLGISDSVFFLIFVACFFIFLFISGHCKIKAEKEKQKKKELAGAKEWLEYQKKRFEEVKQKNTKKDSADL